MKRVTDELIEELERTINVLNRYKNECVDYKWNHDINHAAAKRATLDATRKLAEWRKTGKPVHGYK